MAVLGRIVVLTVWLFLEIIVAVDLVQEQDEAFDRVLEGQGISMRPLFLRMCERSGAPPIGLVYYSMSRI